MPDQEWDVVYFLREVCLGRTVDREQCRVLQQVNMMTQEGHIDPTMKAVVLSAVRGEGRQLRLESPFTDEIDRTISDFIAARAILAGSLSEEEYTALLAEDPKRFDDAIRDVIVPPHLPPEMLDVTEFVRRCREGETSPNQDGQNR